MKTQKIFDKKISAKASRNRDHGTSVKRVSSKVIIGIFIPISALSLNSGPGTYRTVENE